MRLSIGHGRNWKNAYVGQRRRRRGITYFRNRRFRFSLARKRGGKTGAARKKRDRGKKGRRAPRDAKPDLKPIVDLPPPHRSTSDLCSRGELKSPPISNPGSGPGDFHSAIFREPDRARATQNVPVKAPARLRLSHHD